MTIKFDVTVRHTLDINVVNGKPDASAFAAVVARALDAFGIKLGAQLMAQIDGKIEDEVASLEAKMTQATAAVQASVERAKAEVIQHNDAETALRAEVARLQAIVDAGEATPQMEARLQALSDSLDSLAALTAAIDPEDPTTTTGDAG